MLQVLISLLAFLVGISILVTVHEFGHFWVARRFGIKVLRFSLGFGRPLFRWYDKMGTEYVLSAIPFGGYVSLFGEQNQEISPSERQMSFRHKPVFARMLVLLAGPGFNLIFAVLAFWVISLVGVTVFVPILGDIPKNSVAGLAGLQAGQEIVSIEGKPTPSWESVSVQLLGHFGENKSIQIEVRDKGHAALHKKTLNLNQWEDSDKKTNWLEELGLVPIDPVPAVIGKVLPDYPAAGAGLQEGDRVLSADGKLIHSRTDLINYIKTRPLKPVHLSISRHEQKIEVTVTPAIKNSEETQFEGNAETSKKIGFIGVEFPPLKEFPKDLMRIQHYGVWEGFKKATHQVMEYSLLTLEVLKKIIMGQVSPRYIGGPIAIAKYAGESAVFGAKQFLEFLAMLSISLGVLNLLPIPILDGGHLMFCVFELISGRAVSSATQAIGLWLGALILLSFMLLAFYNDFSMFLR